MLVKSLNIDIYTLDSDELITFFTEYQALGQVKISSKRVLNFIARVNQRLAPCGVTQTIYHLLKG